MIKNYILLFLFLFSSAAFGQQLEDRVFEENIQSVRLYPRTQDFSSQFNSTVISMNNPVPLVLEFDDLAYDADMYSAKIIHCDADWTPSNLRDNDYLDQYNEFNVNDYEYSINTRIPYIHYTFQVPRLKRSGNYVLKVYRGRNEKEAILTKRFMVFNNQLPVGASIVPPSRTEDRREGQQLNINVNFNNRELVDPRSNIKVVIRQNQRWDNAIYGLTPTFIREDQKMIEYQLFDGSNVFEAGNEFRFIDLRYVRTRGQNVAKVEMEEDVVFAEAGVDKKRKGLAYVEYMDINGQFGIINVERQNHHLESEYMLVTFNLAADGLPTPPVILGALSNWGQEPEAQMELNTKTNTYQATLLLKQGWYDYQYGIPTGKGYDMESIEGNHFQTENEYEVFIYYRDMGSRYDELIGYTVVNPNKRRI
ncbi:DUF5103 domain-containing protein [Litoribacter ruber]|uniref:DUF5103 domain-containing protein n=1 Tax=Litoribacter ruber TaxID=702568 RepID=A0AAP2G5Z3_9BACT|nr:MULTISPECIES: DUF5103 domain-containing protein [Litoribacter]MBS9525113.1 DUF5103 domain-containing protein [Litoribacter alkaliphilus]MBT0812961.1 DUF5103 domain-containing protein [Litoribacter ruber]